MADGFRWIIPLSSLSNAIRDYGDDVREMVLDTAREWATETEAWMKAEAPWTDRTGNARQKLYGEAEQDGDDTVAYIGGRAEYQIWLETRHAGRYAIVTRAMQIKPPELMDALRSNLS